MMRGRIGVETGIDLYKLADVAEDLVVPTGRRGTVGGQEDLIEEVTIELGRA
jgi:hypothetical protein